MASFIPTALTGITIAFQLLVAATDSFCGLSGQDSIVRAILAPLDSGSGLLLFLALLHYFDYIYDGYFFNLPRWSLLHTPDTLRRVPNLEFPIRTDWRQIEKPTRIAQIRWRESPNEEPSDYEIIPNTSLFIVPYMRAWVPQRGSANFPRHEVVMSRASVQNAAAQSFARFLIVVTWSSILFIGHNVILWLYVARWEIYLPLAFAGLGRLLITIFQASSVFTYSCHYKRVCTWASPPFFRSDRFKSWAWDQPRQQAFSASVWMSLGWDYPTKGFYCLLELLWPRYISKLIPSGESGGAMYSLFRSPRNEEFAAGGCLEVRVSERTSSAVQDLFNIRFLNVPEAIRLMLQRPLIPSDMEKRLFGGLTILPVFVGIFEPVIVGVIDASPVPKGLYLLEQIVVAVFRYYDFCDSSINAKISIALGPGQRLEDPESGTPAGSLEAPRHEVSRPRSSGEGCEQDLGVRQA